MIICSSNVTVFVYLMSPPSELRREVQTGFFVHWAKTAKFLGRNKKVQTGIPHLIPRGRQRVHEYGKTLSESVVLF